ncbi:MAG: hypothetical protein KUG73_04285 [Pseudomonadales bacterium]|nr:hypothetical protein [Pseudomonadales bacterium]
MRNLTASDTTIRSLFADGLSFVTVLSVTVIGAWGLVQVEAPISALLAFSLFMFPALFSTATYFTRDINEASDRLIA